MDSVYEGEKRMSKMTLDEAINHAKKVYENQSVCEDCREEHKQLAEWLEELKRNKDKECEISAIKMFEELGYECHESEYSISYLANYDMAEDHIRISFGLLSHTFYAQHDYNPKDITIDEFKAIQQQLKELGWIR